MQLHTLSAFFEANLVIVFFVYGLSFFTIALVIVLGSRPLIEAGLGRAFSYLLFFSILHGAVEWIDMYNRYSIMLYSTGISESVRGVRFYMLTTSFYFLLISGIALFEKKNLIKIIHIVFLAVLIVISKDGYLNVASAEAETLVRYILGFGASTITGLAFFKLARPKFIPGLPESEYGFFYCIAATFILYGFFGGLVPPPSEIYGSQFLNSTIFFESTGIPVQVFRALCAFFIANFIVFTMALKVVQRIKLAFFALFAIIFVMAGSGHINLELTSKSYNDVFEKREEEKNYTILNSTFDLLYALLDSPEGVGSSKMRKDLVGQFENALDAASSTKQHSEGESLSLSYLRDNFIPQIKDEEWPLKKTQLLEFKELMEQLNLLHLRQIEIERENIEEIYKNAEKTKMAILIAVIIGTLYFGRTISRQIILPLKKLGAGASEFATGNLKHRIEINTADEFQMFAEEFNCMAEKLEKMGARLKELSITDGLTSLYNHRYFYEKLVMEIERSRRYKMKLSLILMDIDNFKHYNDNNGHLAGDDLLRELAKNINDSARSIDFVCRYGGEEFIIILPQAGKEEAMKAAERVRALVEGLSFPGAKNQPLGFVSVSIGVSTYPEDSTDPKELTNSADAALYRAKSEGKNRVIAAG